MSGLRLNPVRRIGRRPLAVETSVTPGYQSGIDQKTLFIRLARRLIILFPLPFNVQQSNGRIEIQRADKIAHKKTPRPSVAFPEFIRDL